MGYPGYVDGHEGIWNNEPGPTYVDKMLPFWKGGCRYVFFVVFVVSYHTYTHTYIYTTIEEYMYIAMEMQHKMRLLKFWLRCRVRILDSITDSASSITVCRVNT